MPLKRITPTSSELQKNQNLENQNFEIKKPKYLFKDLILPNHIEEKLKDVIFYNKHRKKVFEDWGLSKVLPYSESKLTVNLYGPPGTGKTMAANAIASELGQNLLCVNYSEIESKYVGETAKNLEKVFQFANDNNLVIFFDEADAMLSKRVTSMSNSTDVSVNQTRSVLLMLMNNYQGVILFATNFINNFDEAFMRRIQFHIKFELPNEKVRKILWKKYIPNTMPTNVDINKLSKDFSGLSGSDISNAVIIAAFKAARNNMDSVNSSHFEEAVKDILLSKNQNKTDTSETISSKYVSKEYVDSQLK